MITIKSRSYNYNNLIYLAEILERGMDTSCWARQNKEANLDLLCKECPHKLACNEVDSAYHHVLGLIYRLKAEEGNELLDS